MKIGTLSLKLKQLNPSIITIELSNKLEKLFLNCQFARLNVVKYKQDDLQKERSY